MVPKRNMIDIAKIITGTQLAAVIALVATAIIVVALHPWSRTHRKH